MIVNDPTLLTSTTGATQGTGTETDLLDKDVFMLLLIEQLKHQDPLNPMDNQEMTQQLATLSSLEELKLVNSNLETLQTYEASLNNAQSVALIGKHVKAIGRTVELPQDGQATINFYLAEEAATVNVSIEDEQGNLIRVIEAKNQPAGSCQVVWDGRDKDGQPVTPGTYKFSIVAKDAAGEEVQADTFFEGTITSVRFEGGVPILMIGDTEVSLGDIYEIHLNDEGDGNV